VGKIASIHPADILSDTDKTSKQKYAKIRTVQQQYSIGRWSLFALIRRGLIKAPLVKPSPKGRGFRVIDLASLEEYLANH
jgi:hypothetical protein